MVYFLFNIKGSLIFTIHESADLTEVYRIERPLIAYTEKGFPPRQRGGRNPVANPAEAVFNVYRFTLTSC